MHFDANFRLTLESRERRAKNDVQLWKSSAFFVDTERYQDYLRTAHAPDREVRVSRVLIQIIWANSKVDFGLFRSSRDFERIESTMEIVGSHWSSWCGLPP